MKPKATIDLCEGWRLKVLDERNWKLQQWRDPTPSSGARKTKSSEPGWFDTGNYFQRLGPAMAYVLDRALLASDERMTLAEAMGRVEEIRAELMAVEVTDK